MASECKFWNSLPIEIRIIEMETNFKHELKRHLIDRIEISVCTSSFCRDHPAFNPGWTGFRAILSCQTIDILPGAILRYCINGLSSHVLLVGTEINSIHPSLYAGQCTYPASQIHIFTKLFFHSLSQWSCLLFGRLAKILGKIRIYQVSIILLLSSSWLAFSSTDDEVHIYIRI